MTSSGKTPTHGPVSALIVLWLRELTRLPYLLPVVLLPFISMLAVVLLVRLLSGAQPNALGTVSTGLTTVAILGSVSLAFLGTSYPLVKARDSGQLAVLGGTPVSRGQLWVALLVSRGIIAAGEFLILLVISVCTDIRSFGSGFAAAAGALCGTFMLIALGILLGARSRNSERTLQLALIPPIVVLFTSGMVVPVVMMPTWAQTVIRLLPSDWYVHAVGSWAEPDPRLILHLVGMVLLTAVVFVLVGRIFDGGRER